MKNVKPLFIAASVAISLLGTGAVMAATPANADTTVTSWTAASPFAQPVTPKVSKVYSFVTLDADHNGLSRAEIPRDMHFLRANFQNADFDDNGRLSSQELVLYATGKLPAYVGVFHHQVNMYSPQVRPELKLITQR